MDIISIEKKNNDVQNIPDICMSCERQPINDLDTLPFIDRRLIDFKRYAKYISEAMFKNVVSIMATRGCPYNCIYCHKIWPRTHNRRSAENIFQEVKFYYDIGFRNFSFIDDIFNCNKKESSRFFELIIKENMKPRFSFPNGIRGDILTPDYIDLMVEAGTVSLALALETASPRLQKLIRKNINLDRLGQNVEYFLSKHKKVCLDLFIMLGFPTETEEEAMMTLNYLKKMRWIHFSTLALVKIYPGSELEKLAIKSGISREKIKQNCDLPYHRYSETLPFSKSFTADLQLNEFYLGWFLNKERLKTVLPIQMAILEEDELVQKYNSYLPYDIKTLDDLWEPLELDQNDVKEIQAKTSTPEKKPQIDWSYFDDTRKSKNTETQLNVLLLDTTQKFTSEREDIVNVVEQPLGLMYLASYLDRAYPDKINFQIAKSMIDFNSFEELQNLINIFNPDIIGVRSLTFYSKLFHEVISNIREWGVNVPIIAGGPYASSSCSELLKDNNIDVVVMGEGEVTFSELIGRMMENGNKLPSENELRMIPGLAFRKPLEPFLNCQLLEKASS